MSITGLDILLFIIIAATPIVIHSFSNWFRKSRELDEQLVKTYDMSTGETIFDSRLGWMREKHHELEEEFNRNMREHERIVDEYNRGRAAALIDREQYDRLRAMGYDIMGGAQSHIKPKESKPKEPIGYNIKDQFDGVP